ncbi:MAG: electron transfer flavoprotein subunit alpha/FixB family protein [Phycisphaerae bacterium]|jgi:electron transfer flavoprotein alpha subunit
MGRTLILMELDGRRVKRSSLHAVGFARRLGGDYVLLVIGHHLAEAATSLVGYGAETVLTADDPALAEPLADRYAQVVVEAARASRADVIVAAASTFSKDILPRAAALLDAAMLTDVVGLEPRDGQTVFNRPINAGSRIATVALEGPVRVLTVRASAFPVPDQAPAESPMGRLAVEADALPAGTRFVSRQQRTSTRPDLGEARVVVAGGRPLKDAATFEKLIGGLADVLGAAVGSTRAAVDAGMASNDLQIGQTGRVIAADLYIAAGISGSIQHLAGVKDCRVIVAINKDPEAPLVKAATYSLIGDLFQAVPELTEALKKRT